MPRDGCDFCCQPGQLALDGQTARVQNAQILCAILAAIQALDPEQTGFRYDWEMMCAPGGDAPVFLRFEYNVDGTIVGVAAFNPDGTPYVGDIDDLVYCGSDDTYYDWEFLCNPSTGVPIAVRFAYNPSTGTVAANAAFNLDGTAYVGSITALVDCGGRTEYDWEFLCDPNTGDPIAVRFQYNEFTGTVSAFAAFNLDGSAYGGTIADLIDCTQYSNEVLLGGQEGTSSSGSITANGQNVTLTNVDGKDATAIQLTGTWTGTVIVQVSIDGTNFETYTVQDGLGNPFGNITANGVFFVPGIGQNKTRVLATASMTGTLSVTIIGYVIGTSGRSIVYQQHPTVLPYRNLDLQNTGAAIKTTPAKLHAYHFFNTSTSAIMYVKLYDKASAPSSSDTPVHTIPLSPLGGANLSFPDPEVYALGLGIRAVTGVADGNTTSPATNEVIGNIWYT